jgi:antitoxin HicB
MQQHAKTESRGMARGARRRSTAPTTTYLLRLDLIPEEDGSWTVDVPDLPGCVTWGKTREEALKHVHEAIALYAEDLLACGEPVPSSVLATSTPMAALTV